MTTNSIVIDQFVAELRRDRNLAPGAAAVAHGLAELDREADDCPDAAALFEGVLWIARQPRPLVARLRKMAELGSLKGQVVINMREWSGW
jgi:hypothetical protein